MPLYNYVCEECGPFDSWEKMSNAGEACACPDCSAPSARDVAAPRLNMMNSKLRRALNSSDASTSEPKVVNRKHLAGCGCALCKVGPKKPTPTRHKWMIGH